ncbi:MAG: hypothetical protein ACKV2Q_30795 [Planctomycetaceae bacterium]
MRFGTSDRPPLAPNWRLILWAMTLVPALLIVWWSVRQARQPKPDPVLAGRTPDEARRLKRLLNEPRETQSTPLRDDAVRVVAETTPRDMPIDKSLLAAVTDNTFGVTAAEKEAYDNLLAKVRAVPLGELERIAQRDVPFAVLMLEADRYRGEVLTIDGEIRRCQPLAEPAKELASWEAWLFTADSGLNPYRVVFTNLPTGVPLGDDLKPPLRVRVTGYFFKRYSYATANNFHTAPLVLANTMTVLSQPKSSAPRPAGYSGSLTYLAIGILVTFLVVGLAVEFGFRRRSRRRDVLPSETTESPDFTWLDHS